MVCLDTFEYYTDIYYKRLNRFGNDYQSRIEGKRAREFEDFLLKTPKINIFGAVISDILCYFVASILNLVYIYIYTRKKRLHSTCDRNDVKKIGA